MYNSVFIIIVSIVIFGYLLERFLSYLNSTKWTDKLPEELKDVYDADKYKKSQEYKRVNDRFSLLTSSFSLVIILLMLFLWGFNFVDELVREAAAVKDLGIPDEVAYQQFGMVPGQRVLVIEWRSISRFGDTAASQ